MAQEVGCFCVFTIIVLLNLALISDTPCYLSKSKARSAEGSREISRISSCAQSLVSFRKAQSLVIPSLRKSHLFSRRTLKENHNDVKSRYLAPFTNSASSDKTSKSTQKIQNLSNLQVQTRKRGKCHKVRSRELASSLLTNNSLLLHIHIPLLSAYANTEIQSPQESYTN